MKFYCVRCKKKVETEPTSSKKMAHAKLHKGTCPKCKGKVTTFGKL